MSTTNEPRALTAALAQPAFHTRGGAGALHAAERHVERWAPEASASRVRPLRSLGFVDRLIAPWIETAQRSASLRLFGQYATSGAGERQPTPVSWVFPRPWYQDELDWMAAARQAPATSPMSVAPQAMPTAITTRGTYVPTQMAMPAALYEYVAPSLSVAAPAVAPAFESAPAMRSEAYSPLVPLASVHAAMVMQQTMQRLPATAQRSPGLRDVLSTMLARATTSPAQLAVATRAPDLVTPQLEGPRAAGEAEVAGEPRAEQTAVQRQQLAVVEQMAAQRQQLAEVQRVARMSAEREITERTATRVEAELRQRVTPTAPVATQPTEAARTEAARATETTASQRAERARAEATAQQQERAQIEERVARRVAERTRLHEQARSEAAHHARQEPAPSAPVATEAPAERRGAPAEVVAAFAALPPELAGFIAQHPAITSRGDAARAIEQVTEAYRAVELIARNAASGGAIESVRGPRLMMPAGLGGLVAAVDRAHTLDAPVARSQAEATRPSTLAWLSAPASVTPAIAAPTRTAMAAPAFTARYITPTSTRTVAPATSALGAAVTAQPAALGHVAWADRWLARFAGASPQSLQTLQAGVDSPAGLAALAAAAPGTVFVSPDGFADVATAREAMAATTSPFTGPALAAAPAPAAQPAMPPNLRLISTPPADVVRFDDDAETPDDVFAAISQAATRNRATAGAPTPTTSAATAAPSLQSVAMPTAPTERTTAANRIAHAAPSAPGAGFASALASSPFAPALKHILSLPAATTFDVRALFGGSLSATYLAGLLAPASHELDVAAGAPAWARFTADAPSLTLDERVAPSWDATYVAPDDVAPRADGDLVSPRDAELATPATTPFAGEPARQLTTLRSALLSWDAEVPATIDTRVEAPVSAAAARAAGSPARALIDAMSLPMLGDLAHRGTANEPSWAAPGMVAERARAWSVEQERSSADLSFDFVTPELVLAARVYGLGPIEAAQASRLAIAGPGQLGAMASTVDRTFLQAMAPAGERIESERRARVATAYPMPRGPTVHSGELATVIAPSARRSATTTSAEAPMSGEVEAAPAAFAPGAMPAPSSTTFGVERRTPRGAFLWPPATVAALHLNAPAPDGEQSMSVAALELIAAQAVAELGSYAMLSDTAFTAAGDEAVTTADGAAAPRTSRIQTPGELATASPASLATTLAAEPSESDVLATATALIPASRRARFEALYLALGTSGAVSPAARAARALALSGRGDDASTTTAHQRALAAWDVLPVVYAMDDMAAESPTTATSPSATTSRTARRAPGTSEMLGLDARPGMASLSARAGEALGSYVASASPTQPTTSTPSAGLPRELGALLRAPTAAQEMVQTGRPSGRFGGGEAEIPAWFEQAARKMFESQNASTMGDGISMADLTLIAAAPTAQIAASTKTPAAAAPLSPSTATASENKGEQIDIEKLANEVYRHILVLMDVARARNGEPYL